MASRRISIRPWGVVCAALAVVFVAVSPAVRADWDPGNPYKMHYPQLPDLTETGMDVLASQSLGSSLFKLLADDWQCTETGPVSDIHIWGSWLGDQYPLNDPSLVTFKLSIHADIPVGPGGFSQPGEELWSGVFTPGTFSTRLYAEGVQESFYDPNSDQLVGGDTQVWQYNFTSIPRPFIQQVGTIYWLDVQAEPTEPGFNFGWKTTNPLDPVTPHFRDDAVFLDTAGFMGPAINSWLPMRYPSAHPLNGLSIDLAFVITSTSTPPVPEPSTFVLAGFGLGGLALVARRRSQARS